MGNFGLDIPGIANWNGAGPWNGCHGKGKLNKRNIAPNVSREIIYRFLLFFWFFFFLLLFQSLHFSLVNSLPIIGIICQRVWNVIFNCASTTRRYAGNFNKVARFLQISSALPTSSFQYSYFPSLSAHKAWVKISEIFPLCLYWSLLPEFFQVVP